MARLCQNLSWVLVIAIAWHFADARPKRRLDSYISHYEELNYAPDHLENEHSRVKRETTGYNQFHGEPLQFSFSSHGKSFRLSLTPHHTVFHPTVRFIDGQGKPFDYDTSEQYHGSVQGDDKSKVVGTVVGGKFHGVIQTSSDRYHVEPSRRYFKDPAFHSIVYKASDVNFDGESCGAKSKIKEWMDIMQRSGEKKPEQQPLQQTSHEGMYAEPSDRKRRSLGALLECRLKISGDHHFSDQIAKEEGITVASDPTGVLAAVTRVLSRYVMTVNAIYETTNFLTEDNVAEGVKYAVQTVQIYLTVADTRGFKSELAAPLVGVDRFLDVWSQVNYNEFCLAYMFTNRDFDNGVLGLAWVGSAGSSNGGICDKFTRYSDGVSKTLNTGIVTTLNFNKQVAREVSYLTFAHELGHNMGSNHDPATTSCSPGGTQGNYIMFAHATSGTEDNNNRFSPCSVVAIGAVLRSKSPACFQALSGGRICGNLIVDVGTNETCDCGTMAQCTNIPQCCQSSGCALMPTAQCGPQQGPCCDSANCTFVSASRGVNCTEPNECAIGLGTCNGTSAQCIQPPSMPDGTICNDGTATCLSGACTGSLCSAYGEKICFCTGNADRCKVCCGAGNATSPCMPIDSMTSRNVSNIQVSLLSGAPCDNYEGFCDFYSFCRRLDDQGPIARLRSVFFSSQTITNFLEWSKKYWWALALIVVGIIVLMVLIVKFLSKNTKSTVEAKRKKATDAKQAQREGRSEQELNNVRRR